MVLQLDIEIVAEYALQPQSERLRFIVSVHQQILRDIASKAGGKADDALAVLFEKAVIDPRAVIEAFDESDARKLDQVPVTGHVFAEQDQVRVLPHAGLVLYRLRRNVRLHADDRLDARLRALLIKLDHAVHIAVIGDRDRVHAELLSAVDKLADARCAVQQAVFGMHVKMCKAHSRSLLPLVFSSSSALFP